MERYLISTDSFRESVIIANEMHLGKGTWIHISLQQPQRDHMLKGRRVSNDSLLIGSFSDWERFELLRK